MSQIARLKISLDRVKPPVWRRVEVPPAETTTLAQLRRRGAAKKFQYIYDFGDDWYHTVQIEAIIAPEPDTGYPRLLKAKGACPPEDIGGPWGYAEFLAAIADAEHEAHHELVERHDPGFDPAAVDEAAIRRQLEGLSRPAAPSKARSRAA